MLISGLLQKRHGVLELGCGTGGSTRAHVQEAGHLVATDLSREMVRKARRRFSKMSEATRPDFVVCDAPCLPFRSASFDVVFSRGVTLSYVCRPRTALADMRRVLARQGRLALDVMNRVRGKPFVARFFHLQGRSPVYSEVFIQEGLQVRRLFRLPATARYLRWARATRRCHERPREIGNRALSVQRFEARMFRSREIRGLVERAGFRSVRIVPLGHLAYLLGNDDRGLVWFARQNRAPLSRLTVALADHLDVNTALHLFVVARKA